LHSEAGRLAIAKAENEEQLNKSINPKTMSILSHLVEQDVVLVLVSIAIIWHS
jgi:hypothetical protein